MRIIYCADRARWIFNIHRLCCCIIKMKEIRITKTTTYHIISIAAIVVSIYFSIFRFAPVALRVWQSIKDLGLSLAYYAAGYVKKHKMVNATVRQIPSNVVTLLPITWEEFKAFAERFYRLLVDIDNIFAYFDKVGDIMYIIAYTLTLSILPAIMLYIVIRLKYDEVDTNYNVPTAHLARWLKVENVVWLPVKHFVLEYVSFLKRTLYYKSLLLIWCWNLNLITIGLETLAFLFYLPFSMDYLNLFVQVAKLAADLSVSIFFLPGWVWLVIAYKVFDWWRKEKGFDELDAEREHNEDVLERHPGNLLLTAKPRGGKTLTETVMLQDQERIFRKKAKEKSFQHEMEFPYFPWIMVELSIKNMRKQLSIFCLEFIREWIPFMKTHFDGRAIYRPEEQEMALHKLHVFGYVGNNFIFDYDYSKYGTKYNNKIEIIDVFKAVELYAEEYYIYTCPTPLVLTNYPMRTYIRWSDEGNYPLLDMNPLRVDPVEIDAYSQYSHIFIQDMMRQGKQKHPGAPYNSNFEIGAVGISEVGKERGNQKTNEGQKKADDACNTRNDLWELDAKMRSHYATIDFYTYFRIIMDEQRAMSLLADLREIGTEAKIQEKRATIIRMPYFEFEELLYLIITEYMVKLHDFIRSRHGAKTLLYYIALKIYTPVHDHYVRIYNQFSSAEVQIKMFDYSRGDEQRDGKIEKYYVITKQSAGAYATGFFAPYYRKNAQLFANGGINQVPQYSGLMPTTEQMRMQGSYLYDTVLDNLGAGYITATYLDSFLEEQKSKLTQYGVQGIIPCMQPEKKADNE